MWLASLQDKEIRLKKKTNAWEKSSPHKTCDLHSVNSFVCANSFGNPLPGTLGVLILPTNSHVTRPAPSVEFPNQERKQPHLCMQVPHVHRAHTHKGLT